VLFQLLGFLVDAGKGVVQTSFEKLSDQNPNQPVGTTMALIEQGMVVFSSIHSRLHAAMEKCFSILHRLNSAYLTEEDIEAHDAGLEIDPSDFDGPMDVVPVSDPAIFSETQRFAQVQAIMQRSAMMPQLYDFRKVEEMFLRTLKVPANEVLQPMPASEDMDPVSENVAAAMGRPLYVLPRQDHVAHIMTHMAFLKSPVFGGNKMIMESAAYMMAVHLKDHLLNYYLVEAHDAVDRAQREDVIKDEPEQQVAMILQVQQLIEQQLGGFSQELMQFSQFAEQFKPQPPMPPDSSMQVAQLNAQIKGQEMQARMQVDQARLQMEQARLQGQQQVDMAKLQAQEQDRALKVQMEQMRQMAESQRTAETNIVRERMNTSDNDTAKLLAAAEIASGERVTVTTGTGINPNP